MIGLTKAGKFYLFLLLIITAFGYYLYDAKVNRKKIFKCVDSNLTFTVSGQSYNVPRKNISSIKLVDGETIWRPEYSRKSLPCNSAPVATHADLYFSTNHSYFIDLKDPIGLTAEQKKGTYEFFLSQIGTNDKGEESSDGVKYYAIKKDGINGERTFYVMPAEMAVDAYGSPLTLSCYVRRYESLCKNLGKDEAKCFDERCAMGFLAPNKVYVSFDIVKKGDGFDTLAYVKDHLNALHSFEVNPSD